MVFDLAQKSRGELRETAYMLSYHLPRILSIFLYKKKKHYFDIP